MRALPSRDFIEFAAPACGHQQRRSRASTGCVWSVQKPTSFSSSSSTIFRWLCESHSRRLQPWCPASSICSLQLPRRETNRRACSHWFYLCVRGRAYVSAPEAFLQALHHRSCAMSPAPASFQAPWPLSVRALGLGSLSEEHVRAISAHKCVPLRCCCFFFIIWSGSPCVPSSPSIRTLLMPLHSSQRGRS